MDLCFLGKFLGKLGGFGGGDGGDHDVSEALVVYLCRIRET